MADDGGERGLGRTVEEPLEASRRSGEVDVHSERR
jgi:hypothetical protein